MSIDKDGFIHLEWRNDLIKLPTGKDVKRENKKASGKRKSSWKSRLSKELKNAPKRKTVRRFHSTELANYYIPEDAKARFKTDVESRKTFKAPVVMIAIGEDLYMRLSVKTYTKLLRIKKIAVEFRLTVKDDYMNKPETLFKSTQTIISINEFLRFVVDSRYMIDSIYNLQDKASIFSEYDFKYRFAVQIKGVDEPECYDDINELLEEFKIRKI